MPAQSKVTNRGYLLLLYKVRSHGAAAAAIFLPQPPESVDTVSLRLCYIFKQLTFILNN